MTHEAFEAYRPPPKSAALIRQANTIIRAYQSDGLVLTLRQLYYQFVARALIPNSDKSYKRLGNVIAKARMGGFLDWDAIEDRVRQPVIWSQFDTVEDAVKKALRTFRLPRLDGQPKYVELWVEKDALAGVLQPLAANYHVTLMVNRGYSSVSAMKDAGDRVRGCCDRYGSKEAVILYLGDLDPSGEDMVRDIRDRLGVFLNEGLVIDFSASPGERIETEEAANDRKPDIELTVHKIALTIDQVEEHDPPPNPAKLTDSRAKDFIKKYGYESWEVDALPPAVLRDIITEAFERNLDLETMEAVKERENEERDAVRGAIEGLADPWTGKMGDRE